MYKSRVTTKGQVTIPAEFRQACGIHSGDAVEFVMTDDNRLLLQRAKPKAIAAGFLQGRFNSTLSDEQIDTAIADGWAKRGRR